LLADLLCAYTVTGNQVPEVIKATAPAAGALTLPATTTITELIRTLEANSASSASFAEMVAHFKKVASWQVRNVGSITGNLMMARGQHFMSDLATVLMGAGASIRFTVFSSGASFETSLSEFLTKSGSAATADSDLLVTAVVVPFLGANEVFRSYRQAKRANNAHAIVNAALRVSVDAGVITAASFAFGCIDTTAVFASAAEKAIVGKKVGDQSAVAAALDALTGLKVLPEKEYITIRDLDGMTEYRRGLMTSFLYKFFVALVADAAPAITKSAGVAYVRPATTGTQMFKTVLPDDHPGKKPTPKQDVNEQACGNVKYVDDMDGGRDMLYGAIVMGTEAPALVIGLDASAALAMPGVVDFVTAVDIPGFNCASPFGPGEELLFPFVYGAQFWDRFYLGARG
jgi:xanthine dehydrogenase/oxidase